MNKNYNYTRLINNYQNKIFYLNAKRVNFKKG